ncbi:NUDIX domain-containing protein [Streptomyces sp. NPDC047082]|uniref:NUDIX hydrolase n=1 Tax=Streptomyces sp. NPDC047082 TaxID=3155259 RepID=UPI0033DB88F8
MGMAARTYGYVGPGDLKGLVRPGGEGEGIRSAADFARWVSARGAEELAEPFTFVVDAEGVLRLAPRRSEHVVCAGGAPVLGAGEMSFREDSGRWAVDEVSNQSTGYCPDLGSWPSVADALDRAGLVRPSGFTHEVVFRRCVACRQVNVVREDHFVCVLCDADLPSDWNVAPTELFDVRAISFVEGKVPALSAGVRSAMDRVWDEALRADPSLFDGPAVACTGLREEPGSLVLFWARATYRYRGLRRVPGAPSVSSLFVALVQPTDDGRLLVGRMSTSTATPGRLQLPGGSMEPPPHGEPLDVPALRAHAARELAEETGLDTPPEDLALWLVTRGERGNVGFLFRAPARPAELLHRRFAALVAAETAQGGEPELDRIVLVGSEAELAGLGGPRVDYLGPVVRRFTDQRG